MAGLEHVRLGAAERRTIVPWNYIGKSTLWCYIGISTLLHESQSSTWEEILHRLLEWSNKAIALHRCNWCNTDAGCRLRYDGGMPAGVQAHDRNMSAGLEAVTESNTACPTAVSKPIVHCASHRRLGHDAALSSGLRAGTRGSTDCRQAINLIGAILLSRVFFRII